MSVYRQHIDDAPRHHTVRQVRPVVIGAPYVLCSFTVGVILMAVGTFITSHAYEDETRDPVLLGVGPGLLGLGGMLLLSAVLICVVACLRNRRFTDAFSDDFFTIGASTFYGGDQFIQMEDENHRGNQSPGLQRLHSMSGGASDTNEAVMMLANTVAEGRNIQRKNSRKYSRKQHESGTRGCYMGPQSLPHENLSSEDPDYLGLEPIRRVEPLPELAHAFGLSENDDFRYFPRDRSYSMSVRHPRSQTGPVEQRLRRNLTYTQASRARLQQLKLQRQEGQGMQGWETQRPEPQRKRSSKRRKPQATINEVNEGPVVHQLPKYDPDILRIIGIEENRPNLNRGISEDGLLSPGAAQPAWRNDPDVTHGSLDNPRRRPTMMMGVKSLRPKQSGAAYRHSSSIYASDMDLHRTDMTVTSDASQAGHEHRDYRSYGGSSQYPSQPGSTESGPANRSLGSTPVLVPPYNYGHTSPQLDARKEENTPSSTPSHSRRHRPLSNISSASESCCSACCESQRDEVRPQSDEQEHPADPASQEVADQGTDPRPPHSDT